MTLTAKDVETITRLLEESSFDELQLEIDGMKLSMRRRGAAASGSSAAPDQATAPSTAAAERARKESPPAAPGPSDESVRAVPAPLLGTFYRAPKPGAPPFIEVGSVVAEDTVIGIIEVMKLMNSVRAGLSGTVIEILAQDGALVEYGEALLRVRKAVGA